jgi:uncharacterized protein (TIGR02588 family)
MKQKQKSEQNQQSQSEQIPLAEWVVGLLGFLLVAATIIFLLYEGVQDEGKPPHLSISIRAIEAVDDHYLVRFRVQNNGDLTAAAVTIEGALKQGEETIEASDTSLTYVPAQSYREGGLFFTENPADFELELRPVGYEKP